MLRRRPSSVEALEPVAPLAEVPRDAFPLEPPVSLPPHTSAEQIEVMLRSLCIDDSPPDALEAYVDDSFGRFLYTLGLAAPHSGRCLEIGANPYFTTVLLQLYTELDLELTNHFGPDTPSIGHQRISVEDDGTTHGWDFEYRRVNVERDRMPYADDSFELVLFCEVIEHLTEDPLFALREIHRVLRPGGSLILTTPNVARLGNVLNLALGGNIYDPYSGFGPYGRHNREYNRHELHLLLGFAGFDVANSFTADAHPSIAQSFPWYQEIGWLLLERSPDLGQYLFVEARAEREPRYGYPAWLYRNRPDGEIVDG